MALGSPAEQRIEWRLRDLAFAGLFALLFLVPLTFVTLPFLLQSRWHLAIVGISLEALAALPAVTLVARWRGARHLVQFGLGRYPCKMLLVWGCAGGVVLFAVVQGCGSLLEAAGAHLPPQRLLTEVLLAKRSFGRLAAFLFAAALVAPVWEEVFFRGLAYAVLRSRLGVSVGAILSAMLFAILHAEPWPLRLPVFLLGVLLALAYEATGSLYVPMLAHGVANAISTFLAYLGVFL